MQRKDKHMKHTYILEFGREVGINVYNFLWARTYTTKFELLYHVNIIKEALITTGMFDKVEEYTKDAITHVYLIIK